MHLRAAKYTSPPMSVEGQLLNLHDSFPKSSGSTKLIDSNNNNINNHQFTGSRRKHEKLKVSDTLVLDLVGLSSLASEEGKRELALNKARESVDALASLKSAHPQGKSKQLGLVDSSQSMTTGISLHELSVMVNSNLAAQLKVSAHHEESIELYTQICKIGNPYSNANSQQQQDSRSLLYRFGLNIGNTYFEIRDYQKALKYYRLTLDRLSSVGLGGLKMKLMNNIALTLMAMQQPKDTIVAWNILLRDNIVSDAHTQQISILNSNHHQFGLNLMICLHREKDLSSMMSIFKGLVRLNSHQHYERVLDLCGVETNSSHFKDRLEMLIEEKQAIIARSLVMACDLMLDLDKHLTSNTYVMDFCMKLLTESESHKSLASDIKANSISSMLAKKHKLAQVINLLEGLEEQVETRTESIETEHPTPLVRSSINFTNFSLLYLLQNKAREAIDFAQRALKISSLDAQGLINLANCYYQISELDEAGSLYRQALSINPSCWVANYNLTIVNRKLGRYYDILNASTKLCLSKDKECFSASVWRGMLLSIIQLALIQHVSRNYTQSGVILDELIKSSQQAPEVVLLASSGCFNAERSLEILQQAFKEHPYHLALAERIIALHIQDFKYNLAKMILEDCIKNRPDQVKWYRMLADCYRHTADYIKAESIYKYTVELFPQDATCLKDLVKLQDELGLTDGQGLLKQKLTLLTERLLSKQPN